MSVKAMFRQLMKGRVYNLPNVTNFSDWPEWLKVLVLVPHGVLASVACWLWWPTSEKGWRRFGFVVAYLLVFYVVMRYVSLGNAQGIISGNVTVIGSTGVYSAAANVTVSGNTLVAGTIGISINSPAVSVSSNRIFNSAQAGISLQSANDTVRNNRIIQVPIGIEFNCYTETSGGVTGNIINGASTGLDLVPSGFAGVNNFFGVANLSTG